MPPFNRLVILDGLLDGVVAHARIELPNECCGLLAGLISEGVGYAFVRAPVRNDLASPKAYSTNATDLFAAFRAMRPKGEELLAVYHSHPTSAPVPSRRDMEENTYGETVAHLIVGLAGAEPEVRAWWITESGFQEVELTAS